LSFTFSASRYTLEPISLNFWLIAAMPSSMVPDTHIPTLAGSFSVAAYSRPSCVIFIEQNFGPHIEQKWATLWASLGRVSSWKARAVAGSGGRMNWALQRKANGVQ